MYGVVLAALLVSAGCGDDGGGSAVDARANLADAAPCTDASGCWSAFANVAGGDEVQEISVVELRGKIYAIGGFDSTSGLLAAVHVYDPQANTWAEAAPLPQALHHTNAAVVNGKIYVLGALQGISFDTNGRTWEYDPDADTWTEKAPMPPGTERGGAVTGVINGIIYLAGGVRGRAVADFSSYDPALDQWDTSLPPLSGPTDHLVGGVVDDVFYVIGGRNGSVTAVLDRVEAFDPSAGQWTPKAPMPTARGGCAAGVIDGKIIVVGGEGNEDDPDGVFPQTESYDPALDQWTTLTPMLTPRHGMGAVGFDGKLWVPGGATRHFFAASSISEVFVPGPGS